MEQTKEALILVGLPRGGKSTWARKQGLPIVDPDGLRMVLGGKKHCPEHDKEVWRIAPIMLAALFEAGHDKVIVDSTSLTRARRMLFASPNWKQTFIMHLTPLKTCEENCRRLGQEEIIPHLARKAEGFEPISQEEGKIFEIQNGTLIEIPHSKQSQFWQSEKESPEMEY